MYHLKNESCKGHRNYRVKDEYNSESYSNYSESYSNLSISDISPSSWSSSSSRSSSKSDSKSGSSSSSSRSYSR
ncbi:hypothetical protein [Clostridium sp.]|uniref:hypothetical protein n=1 Tax=Clostridium sp. TaxID=1506 RepID=UPI003D6D8705